MVRIYVQDLKKDHAARPDPFRLKYKRLLYSVTGQIVKKQLEVTDASIAGLAAGRGAADDADRSIKTVNEELQTLHEGILARYRLRPAEFIKRKQLQNQNYPSDRSGSR